jgi:hypothetical protein
MWAWDSHKLTTASKRNKNYFTSFNKEGYHSIKRFLSQMGSLKRITNPTFMLNRFKQEKYLLQREGKTNEYQNSTTILWK